MSSEDIIKRNVRKRILLVGLGGVGKTSIGLLLRTMNKEIAEKTVPSVSIERYDRNFVGKKIDLFVAPGQKRFLASLLRRIGGKSVLTELLEKSDIIIYVVDSSDYNRLPEMFNYFKILVERIIDIKAKNNLKKKIILLAHKQDLPNAMSEKAIEEFFITPLKPIFQKNNLEIEVFGTTIYRPATLLKVLYSIIEEDIENYELLVKQIGIKFSAETVFLGDSEGILIASYGDYELSWELLLFFLKFKSMMLKDVSTYAQTIINPDKLTRVIFQSCNKTLIFLNVPLESSYNYSVILGIINPQVKIDLLLSEIEKIMVKITREQLYKTPKQIE